MEGSGLFRKMPLYWGIFRCVCQIDFYFHVIMWPMIRPQSDFPLMEEYKAQGFAITDKTIFALGVDIYTNYPLSPDLMVHELVHLKQQQEVGVKEWVYDFLYTPSKRLEYELEAYKMQINSIKDRNYRAKVWLESAKNLSSPLYGNIISYEDAKAQLSPLKKPKAKKAKR